MPDGTETSAAKPNQPESSPSEMTAASKARVDLGDITPHNIKLLKKINQVVFPVVYHDNFYKDVLEAGELAKLAFFNDIVVGAVCCRVETAGSSGEASAPSPAASAQPSSAPGGGKKKLYIMTLGCLAPYRRLGVGSKMVEHVLSIVEKDGSFESVFLHVQINNEGAIDFYKNFGFDVVDTKENYYKRIDPADAYVLEKKLDGSSTGAALTNGNST